MNILTNQGKAARCTAHALYNAVEALLGKRPGWTPNSLWYAAQEKLGGAVINDLNGARLWMMLWAACKLESSIAFPEKTETDFTEDDIEDMEEGRAVAVLGYAGHAVAVIDAKRGWFGMWKLRIEDSRGEKPRWRYLWKLRTTRLEVAIIRKKHHAE